MPPPPSSASLLSRAQKPFAVFGLCYWSFVFVILASPFLQRHLLYMHAARWPIWADFNTPERYGMAPGRTKQLQIDTPSGEKLGAWFTFAESYYREQTLATPLSGLTVTPTLNISHALETRPTILYFHGNAASRAVPMRVWIQRTYSSSLPCNVLAIDYRGFGDSTGTPGETGLTEDAVASWDWLTKRGAAANDIIIMGQSLGTAVGVRLAVSLAETDQYARGVVLFAPFSSVLRLLKKYKILGWLPLAVPMMSIPFGFDTVDYFLRERWDTESIIRRVKSPLVVFHARDDWDIPATHSASLFVTLLSLPELDGSSTAKYEASVQKREKKRAERVTAFVIEKVGRVQQMYVAGVKATFVEMLWGGHNSVVVYEGALRVLQEELHLWK